MEALKTTTKLLLQSGAKIDDVNTVRKHTESLKGGQLARLISMKGGQTILSNLLINMRLLLILGSPCVTFIISDVVGDDLSTIASGPTVPDDSTFFQARPLLVLIFLIN